MRQRLLFVSLGVTALSVVAAIAWAGWRDYTAGELVERARARLDAPLSEAPGIDRLQASTAASLLERAIEAGRRDDETVGLLAYAHALEDYQRGDMVLAEGELTSARHRFGRDADVEVLAAAVARARSRQSEAEAILAGALTLEPDHVHGRLLAADLALDAEDGRAALGHLREIEDDVAAVHNRRGLAHELGADDEAAAEAYADAVRVDPTAHEAWINLGRLRRRRGAHERALDAFDQAVRAAESDGDAHLGRGLTRAALGDVHGAQADFARAAELSPNDAEPLLALGDLQRDLRSYEDAVATYRAAIAREDADAASWLKLGNALALLEHYDDAAGAFRNAIERAPELAAAFNGLGASLMHLGRAEQARIALDRAAALDRADPNPLMNLALLHEREGDDVAARAAWERALERDPGSAIARRRLARL